MFDFSANGASLIISIIEWIAGVWVLDKKKIVASRGFTIPY